MNTESSFPASPALVRPTAPKDTYAYAKVDMNEGKGVWGGSQLTAQNSTFGLLVQQISEPTPRQGRALSITGAWGALEPKLNAIEHVGFMRDDRARVCFCTGSQYTGQWDRIGMSGFGTFVFPHKVEYEGEIKDGMFHGEGTLHYPMGQKMDGEWSDGHLISMKYHFPEGLSYEEPWRYCLYPDRRFYMSVNEGLRPAGRELRTNTDPPRTIPPGCYDVGDGFYDPQTKCVVSPINLKKIIRIPTAAEEHWIMTNCRKAWDEPTGYRPELYPQWCTGSRRDIEDIYRERTSEEAFATLSKYN